MLRSVASVVKNGILILTILMYLLSLIHLSFSVHVNYSVLLEQRVAQNESVEQDVWKALNTFACIAITSETLNVQSRVFLFSPRFSVFVAKRVI